MIEERLSGLVDARIRDFEIHDRPSLHSVDYQTQKESVLKLCPPRNKF